MNPNDHYRYMVASMQYSPKYYQYIEGQPFQRVSIAELRFDHLAALDKLSKYNKLTIAVRNPKTDTWTKWLNFNSKHRSKELSDEDLRHAYDVHRSMIDCEIVVESDYPSYEENLEATKIIGQMLETKGYLPYYYYSGSKSIHIHIFIDFEKFKNVDLSLVEEISKTFTDPKDFFTEFMIWLRTEVITMWGTNIREFDRELINPRS